MSENSLAMLESLALAGLASRRGVREPCEVIRAIEAMDIPTILQELKEKNWHRNTTPDGSNERRVLRTSHHKLAQLLAGDVSPVQAAFITGRSVNSVESLMRDPAFNELLAFYRTQTEEQALDIYDRQITLGLLASEIIQERLEENPEKFSNTELRNLLEGAVNGSGSGSGQTLGRRGDGPLVQINFVKSARGDVEIEGTATLVEEKKNEG